jgi:DNA repair exonuclease SbcCD ATPase subunit
MAEQLTMEQAQEERAKMAAELWDEDGTAKTGDIIEDRQPPPEQEPAPEDPYAGLPSVLKQEIEDLKAKAGQFDALSNRLKQAESRIGSVTNKLHEAEKAASDLKKEKENAPSQQEIADAATSDAEWEDLREEFPAWATAMDNRLAAERKRTEASLKAIQDLQSQVEGLKGGSAVRTEINRELVESFHPGWETTVQSSEFGEFFKTLAADVQQKAHSERPADAIYVLNLFRDRKAGTKTAAEIQQDRKERLTKSQLPSPGRVRQPVKSDEELSDEEYRAKIAQEIWDD